jgi:hypothetical protein
VARTGNASNPRREAEPPRRPADSTGTRIQSPCLFLNLPVSVTHRSNILIDRSTSATRVHPFAGGFESRSYDGVASEPAITVALGKYNAHDENSAWRS